MAGVLNPALAAYLREAAGRPFAWGVCDCCLFAADWVVRARELDPAASFRGRYASKRGALRLITEAGSLDALMSPAMERCGLPQTDDPIAGDVGVVDAGRPAVAIRTRGGWACKSLAGLIVTPATPIRAWAV